MEKYKILVVDDDEDIRKVLNIVLTAQGYSVIEAKNGQEAIDVVEIRKNEIDLIILDIMMPEISGTKACQIIREKTLAPILFLTAKSQDEDKILAYTNGGDDYLVKPFYQTELLLKINSLLRKWNLYKDKNISSEESVVFIDDIKIDFENNLVFKNDTKLSFTDTELKILFYLVKNRGKVLSTQEIFESVWNEKYLPSSVNTIMVHILKIRKKIEKDPSSPKIINTVWGKGYKVD